MAFVMFAPEGIWGLLTSRLKGELPGAGAGNEPSDAAA